MPNLLTRRDAMKLGAAAIGASTTPRIDAAPSPQQKDLRHPNFVIFMTDGQRLDQLGCMTEHAASALAWNQNRNSSVLSTPNMDRIAQEGAQFHNAFATNALCAPSRASFLTGLYSKRNGVIDNNDRPLNPGIEILSDFLHEAGYEVAFCGKSHIQGALRDHYWDYYFGYLQQQPYLNPQIAEGRNGHIGPDKPYHGYLDDLVVDAAVRWLQEDHDKPFCLFVWLKVPHGEGIRPRRLQGLYDGVFVSEPETFNDDLLGYPARPNAVVNASNKVGTFEYCATLEQIVKSHNANTVAGDEYLGRLLRTLENSGCLDDTAVVTTSDHGYFLGEWHCIDKRLMYEPSIRIPLNIRYPKRIPAGTVLDRMVLNIDLAPTILDLAGCPIPAHMQGQSIVPLLQGGAAKWRTDWLYSFYDYPSVNMVPKNHGVRTERYKLIEYYEENPPEWELFDLRNDPHELHNLYGDPGYRPIVEQLQKRMEDLLRETGEA